jgi:hypothetical protein
MPMPNTTFSGTLTAPDGAIINLGGTLTYPEPPVPNTTLAPVQSNVIIFDSSDIRKAYAVPGTNASVTGIDRKIQEMCGFKRPVNKQRAYKSMSEYISADDDGLWTLAALDADLELVNLFTHAGDRVAHYGDETMRSVLRGERDELARQVVRKRRGRRYFPIFHEPELHGATPILYRMALHRMMRVMIEEAQRIGLSPNEFCVGGCLTDKGMVSDDETWWWWDGLAPDLLASNMVGGFWNPYWLDGMTNTFGSRIARQAALLADAGINRWIVSECAKYGSVAQQIAFIGDVDQTITNLGGALELVAFFHDPGGPASGTAQFKGDAVIALGKVMQRRNR